MEIKDSKNTAYFIRVTAYLFSQRKKISEKSKEFLNNRIVLKSTYELCKPTK